MCVCVFMCVPLCVYICVYYVCVSVSVCVWTGLKLYVHVHEYEWVGRVPTGQNSFSALTQGMAPDSQGLEVGTSVALPFVCT